MGKISEIMDFGELKMQNLDEEYPQGIERVGRMHNFTGEYLQGIERVGWGCVILLRSILTLSKTCDVDVKFAKEVSSNPRKSKM